MITKIIAPLSTSPSVFASPVVAHELQRVLDIDSQSRFKHGFVRKGSSFNIGGVLFVADSDTAISGFDTGLVKFTVTGNTATVDYVSASTTITWNDEYNGYYDESSVYHAFTDYGCAVIRNTYSLSPEYNIFKTVSVPSRQFSNAGYSTIATITINSKGNAKLLLGYTLVITNALAQGDSSLRVVTSTGVVLDSWADAANVTRVVDCDFSSVIGTDITLYVQYLEYGNTDERGAFGISFYCRDRPQTYTTIPPKTLLLHKDAVVTMVAN